MPILYPASNRFKYARSASDFRARRYAIQNPPLFSPSLLFAAMEQGAWYDPSDLTTLYQDAAGTTPVTAVEQPVGLMLDKSQGLVLGPVLFSTSTFTEGWSLSAAASIVNGTLVLTAAGNSSGAFLLNPPGMGAGFGVNKYLEVTFEIVSISSGAVSVSYGYSPGTSNPKSSPGVYTVRGYALDTYIRVYGVGASTTAVIDNISVRELPGNHAFQTTATSRPVLSARYNLLTKTEQFDDGAWQKNFSAGVTANQTEGPFGELSADLVSMPAQYSGCAQSVTLSAGVSYTLSAWVRAAAGTNSYHLAAGAALQIFTPASEWQLVSMTFIAAGGAVNVYPAMDRNTTGFGSIYIWGASLVPANQAHLPYQRVNTATDYDAGPAFPRYLRCDGIDDWMVTGTITPGTDKAQVFAGVRKLSDAARGVLAELSASTAGNAGSFVLTAPEGATSNYGFGSRGVILNSPVAAGPFPAPITNVLTGVGNISGDSVILRVNGTQAAQSTADQGTGNFLAYPLYLFRRGGTTFPFNGHFYGGIIRFGPNLPIETIQQTEAWMAAKTGVTL